MLDTSLQEKFLANPEELFDIVKGLSPEITHVVIDEVQKVPKLLDVVLSWGTLAEIMDFSTDQERHELLTAYAHTYLREEIWEEQFVKALTPYR